MSNNNLRPTAPCIINEGTIINKKDMMRALETLECVEYIDLIDKKIHSKGEGIVLKVFASRDSATLVINGSIFLNVMSFDHLSFYVNKEKETIFDLISGPRVLKLIPREEDPKLIAKINQNSFDYQDEVCNSEDGCAHHLLDENFLDIEEDDR